MTTRKRLLVFTFGFTFLHAVITASLEIIGFSRFGDIDHPERHTSLLQQLCYLVVSTLMQPLDSILRALKFEPAGSAIEWTFFLLNSLVWGIGVATIVFLISTRKKSAVANS